MFGGEASCLLPVGVCIDAYLMIGSYLVRVNLVITHLQLKNMSVLYYLRMLQSLSNNLK